MNATTKLLKTISFTLIFSIILTSVFSQSFEEVKKLLADDGEAGDRFGRSVSIFGNIAVVGAYNDDDNGNNSGSAYILYKDEGGSDNWGEVVKLIASDGAADDEFGRSVGIFGDIIIVGAQGNNNYSGAVYVFYKDEGGTDNWGEVAKLTASDAAAGDFFGISVDIDGDIVVIGAYKENNTNGNLAGSAYIFSKDEGGADNWGEITKLTNSDGIANDEFGYSVSISQSNIIVGTYKKADDTGAAYIFSKDEGGTDNWGEVKKVTASDAATGNYFGVSVNIYEDYAIVGSTGNLSTYIFSVDEGGPDNWGQISILTPTDAGLFDQFGLSVCMYNDILLVGSPEHQGEGAVYQFNKPQSGWANMTETANLIASDVDNSSRFGSSVDMSGNFALIGAYYDNDNGDYSGSAYILESTTSGVHILSPFKFIVSPNPTSSTLKIELENDSVFLIKISDIKGRVIYKKNNCVNEELIDISNLENGMYIIALYSNNKEYFAKFLKE